MSNQTPNDSLWSDDQPDEDYIAFNLTLTETERDIQQAYETGLYEGVTRGHAEAQRNLKELVAEAKRSINAAKNWRLFLATLTEDEKELLFMAYPGLIRDDQA
jgi:flagellar biosynthesis/type III secretory pathway protein FliH